MTVATTISIMISSRVRSRFKDARTGKTITLAEVRDALRNALEAERLFGQPLFDVWLSDDPEDQSQGRTQPALEGSLKQVRDKDIVLVLYNGEAGWLFPNQTRGICHLEFLEVWNKERPKLGVLRIKTDARKARRGAPRDSEAEARDQAFRADIDSHREPISTELDSLDAIIEFGTLKAREIAVDLVGLGRFEARRAAYSQGAPLDWSRLDFARRKQQMEAALGQYFKRVEPESEVEDLPQGYIRTLSNSHPVLFICHGIPAAMSVAAAREMVGQPFLRDHVFLTRVASHSDQPSGPVHLIACAKSVTESQAMRQLGFPDATIVKTNFGVYVADHVQMIQMVFLNDCHDTGATSDALARFFEWLHTTEEEDRFCQRALGRGRIVRTIIQLQHSVA